LILLEDITSHKQAKAELQEYRESLEETVKERTADLAQINEQLFWQANYDELTQLLNRRAFRVCLNQRYREVKRDKSYHTLCYLDLDHFKPVNDTCGHQAGDESLRQVSRLFESCCRQSDTICRLGGDEFVILLYQCFLENAERTANSILEKFNNWKFTWEGHQFQLGVSIGLAEINAEIESPESVLIAADRACYKAKQQGRNRFQVHGAPR
jgi:diguanylate cyclase (GGDEF)-like protein